ncbi:uncharacterized protein LOC136068628 isoform X1 [Quercus suber]|uniref:uncharacterized protein LOC136068628 isoform X1 n=1 Tax=Quercus suber TaxID=58331 RepID=UPI0032DFEEDA
MASDFALSVPAELESALRLMTVQYFVTKRRWLGFMFQISMELMLGLLQHLEVLVANHMLSQHYYIAVCLMNFSLRYCMLG